MQEMDVGTTNVASRRICMTWNKACWEYREIAVHFQWEGRVCAAGGLPLRASARRGFCT